MLALVLARVMYGTPAFVQRLMEVFVQRDGGCWVEAYHNVDLKPAK